MLISYRVTSVLPIALAMATLTAMKRHDEKSVDGWVGKVVAWLDKDAEPSAVTEKEGTV